jgi:predicted RNA-binding Zn-ribbon protein involved in translation (DUF1610 family)
MIDDTLLIDIQFIPLLSSRLRNFKQKKPYLWNFSCPICGDSKKKQSKARGYFYREKQALHYKCWNCGEAGFFAAFIKRLDPSLHREYLMEVFKNDPPKDAPNVKEYATEPLDFKTNKAGKTSANLNILTLNDLPDTHFARQYIKNRLIPEKFYSILHFTQDFRQFVSQYLPDKSQDLPHLEARIVIPFCDSEGKLLGFSGRNFYNSGIRYITLKLDEKYPKVFGLDTVDASKRIIAMEGPLDTMFIDNAIASMDSNLLNMRQYFPNSEITFVWDCEPRNQQIVKSINRAIDAGEDVCVWPSFSGGKDINDMVKNGYNPQDLQDVIHNRTFSGIQAKMELAKWAKV